MSSAVSNNSFKMAPDTLAHALSFLPLPALSNAAQTCKAFQLATTHPAVWSAQLATTLKSQCPDDVLPIEYEAYKRSLEGIKAEGECVQAQLAPVLPRRVVLLVRQYADLENILRKGAQLVRAGELYKVFPQTLIDAIGGFEAYEALPTLVLDGTKRERRGEITIHNLRQDNLVDPKSERRCSVMKGVQKHAPRNYGRGEVVQDADQRFISIAIDIRDDGPGMDVLTIYERPKCRGIDKLGKATELLPAKYRLGSNMLNEEDIQAVASICADTHKELQLGNQTQVSLLHCS